PVMRFSIVSPVRSICVGPFLEGRDVRPEDGPADATGRGGAHASSASGYPNDDGRLALVGDRFGLTGVVRGAGLGLRCARACVGLRWRRRRGLRAGGAGAVLAQLPDPSLLPDLATEVVQLGPVHVADRRDLDLVDLRRVERERPLDTDAEGLLADSERLARAGPLALEDDSLEDLDPVALALDHLEVDADGVPRLELRKTLAQLGALEAVDHVAHRKEGPEGPTADASECESSWSRA